MSFTNHTTATGIIVIIIKVSPLRAMKAHGDVDARVHILTALG